MEELNNNYNDAESLEVAAPHTDLNRSANWFNAVPQIATACITIIIKLFMINLIVVIVIHFRRIPPARLSDGHAAEKFEVAVTNMTVEDV